MHSRFRPPNSQFSGEILESRLLMAADLAGSVAAAEVAAGAADVDLAVSIVNDQAGRTSSPGDIVSYTVTANNVGDSLAVDARVVADLGPFLEHPNWRQLDGLMNERLGALDETFSLAAGASTSWHIEARVARASPESIRVSVQLITGEMQTDTNPENNSASDLRETPFRLATPFPIGNVRICLPAHAAIGENLFFIGWNTGSCSTTRPQASSGSYFGDLWVTDGTREGTHLVRQIRPNPNLIDAFDRTPEFTVYNDVLYFEADDGEHGPELWRSDGTESGTYLVRDINPERSVLNDPFDLFYSAGLGSEIEDMTVYDGKLVFRADDGAGPRIWESDGTAEGTVPSDLETIPVTEEAFASDFIVDDNDTGRFFRATRSDETRRLPLSDWNVIASTQPIEWGSLAVFSDGAQRVIMRSVTNAIDLRLDSVSVSTTLPEPGEEFNPASDVLSWTPGVVESMHPVQVDYGFIGPIPISTQAVVGDSPEYLTLRQDESVVVGFSNLIVDGPGHDIVVEPALEDVGVGARADVLVLGKYNTYLWAGSIDDENRTIDLADAGLTGEYKAVRIVGRSGEDTEEFGVDVRAVRARSLPNELILEAGSAWNLDFQFAWDLDGDGEFGDRIGRVVGLTRNELLQFGLDRPGVHEVSVRMSDRRGGLFEDSFSQFVDLNGQPIDSVSVDEELPGLPGDFNSDGEVDFTDFLILSANFGTTDADPDEGDVTGDNSVDFTDFLLLSTRFGETAP